MWECLSGTQELVPNFSCTKFRHLHIPKSPTPGKGLIAKFERKTGCWWRAFIQRVEMRDLSPLLVLEAVALAQLSSFVQFAIAVVPLTA